MLLEKALFLLFPSTENHYNFDFGPSEPDARLIDETSWWLVNMPIYFFASVGAPLWTVYVK